MPAITLSENLYAVGVDTESAYFEPLYQIKQKFAALPSSAWGRGTSKNFCVKSPSARRVGNLQRGFLMANVL